MSDHFHKDFNCQVFTVGQVVAVKINSILIEAVVESVDFAAGSKHTEARGQLVLPTTIEFTRSPGSLLKLQGQQKGRTDLFNKEFDFGKLGYASDHVHSLVRSYLVL